MTANGDYEIFLATAPGLEAALAAEAREKRVRDAKPVPGGVTAKGNWAAIWRANLEVRGASRILVRIAKFRASHLSELDKRARNVAWAEVLKPGVPVRVEAACKRSRIYHSGAAAERIERAIREELGAPISVDAGVTVMARIESDQCTISVDSSGDLLHKRGHKEAVAKAPMRENMAALFLRQCGFTGSEPVLDPMCGSGTFVIEAAEIAAGLKPGRSRRFAFEQLASFDAGAWQKLKAAGAAVIAPETSERRFFGFDRDAGAVRMSRDNAERAGVDALTIFREQLVEDLVPPEGPPGLVIVNPPYGDRIGDKARLAPLYRALGQRLSKHFAGWRAAIITADPSLGAATGLPFMSPGPPVAHGGLRVTLFQTGPLRSS